MNLAALHKPLAIAAAMLIAAGLTIALTPKSRLADQRPRIDLEAMIPERFGQWQVDPTVVPVQVSPDVQSRLDKLYSQTLARTYVDAAGRRVMLSIAYGVDQRGETTQVHRPEFCYASQGFQILRSAVAGVTTRFGALAVRRLVAVQGRRMEPITYWVTVGERATLPGISRKLNQLAYGLAGTVPDGMLVRVSSIDSREDAAYANQEQFIEDMLEAVSSQLRARLAGMLG